MGECPFLESFQTNLRIVFTARLYLSLRLHLSRVVCSRRGCLFLPQLVSSPINPLQLDEREEVRTVNVSEMRPFAVCNSWSYVSSNMLPLCMSEHLAKWRLRERWEPGWTEVRRGEAVVMLTVPRGCNICPAGDDEERLRGRLANNVSSLRESEHFQRI